MRRYLLDELEGDAYAVLCVGVQLTHTMPMERSTIVLHFIAYRDLKGVTPVTYDGWTWHRVVDEKAGSFMRSVRVAGGIGDAEIVSDHTPRIRPRVIHVGRSIKARKPTVSTIRTVGTA